MNKNKELGIESHHGGLSATKYSGCKR